MYPGVGVVHSRVRIGSRSIGAILAVCVVGLIVVPLWLIDFGLSEPISRSDFDGNGNVTINDLSVWLEIWARGTSIESATSYCP